MIRATIAALFLAASPQSSSYDTIPTSSLDLAGTVTFSHSSVSASTDTSASQVVFIGVDDTTAARTVTLKSADAAAGRVVIVVDESGGAGTNNSITIATEGAETISGSASVSIDHDYGWVMVYSDGTNWFLWGRGTDGHGQIYDSDTGTDTAFVINKVDSWHSYHSADLAGDELDGFTFEDGGAGTPLAVSAVADGGGGEIAVTTAAHSLAVGDIVSMTNCTDTAYDGVFVVNTINSATEFEVTATYTATDATCVVDRAAMLEAGVGVAGDYQITWTASATVAGGGSDIFNYVLYKNATQIGASSMRRKFGAAGDYGAMGGSVLVDIADGDKISFAVYNDTDADNPTFHSLTINAHKL